MLAFLCEHAHRAEGAWKLLAGAAVLYALSGLLAFAILRRR